MAFGFYKELEYFLDMNEWEIEYNAILLVADVFLVLYFLKRKNLFTLFSGIVFYIAISFAFAFIFAPDFFAVLRLLCYAIFFHGLILCDVFFLLLYKIFRPLALLSVTIGFLILITGIDAFFIEPHSLQISRVEMKSNKLKEPLKIAVLSDLQTDEITDYEKKVIDSAMAEKPDIILMPGDYIQIEDVQKREELYRELNQILKEKNFSAPQGVYAVSGNVDASDWAKIFEGTEVLCFTESGILEKEKFVITALDLDDSFNSDIKIQRKEKFHIAFGHAPDFALSKPDTDLLIAGHTHGGQVRIPFLGPLFTLSSVPGKWAAGVTDIDGDTKLVVSRGIGIERDNAPRLRFFCRPEIVVVTVSPE